MISPRYAAPVAAVLLLALVPTVIHSYRAARRDDGLRADAIPVVLDGLTSSPTERRAAWVHDRFESDNWVERVYEVDGTKVTLFVARSYDPKRLYHHPELAVLRGIQATSREVTHTAARPDIPLHVLETERDDRHGVAVYALMYAGRFIDNPVLFQLRTSAELLVSGRQPMTLFISSDLVGSRERLADAPATRILLAAIESFERQARASSRP